MALRHEISAPVSRWTAAQLAGLEAGAPAGVIPPIAPQPRVSATLDLWDVWPLQAADGTTVVRDGWSLWFVLSAPVLADPDDRHDVARIRLMSRRIDSAGQVAWRDHGNALPDGLCPGAREWAGSALFDPASAQVTLFFTAAGIAGETRRSFAQRIFATTGHLAWHDDAVTISRWSGPCECFAADGAFYQPVSGETGVPGFIKGFRDPAFFRDPADGASYLLFTGSLAQAHSDWNGCIGIARAADDRLGAWRLLPPLVSADGLNNEQERPHIVIHGGAYYLFWSTQARVFAPDAPAAPTGLYAMVADRIGGPWLPVNGTGLVAGNPPAAPYQTYSWWVETDLSVAGFVDYPEVGAGGLVDDGAWRRRHFGATPAPVFRIGLSGQRGWVE